MKALDFNALEQPTWEVKLRDEAGTVVHIAAPTVDLYDRLIAATPEMEEVSKHKDGRTIKAVYDLVADLICCNNDGYTFTGEELRVRYKMSLLDIFRFVAGYLEFVNEVQSAKN